MTKHTDFPIVNIIATLLAAALIAFLFTVPRHYLMGVTSQLRDKAREAEYAALGDDLVTVDEKVNDMCMVFERAEQPLKLFLNHEDIDELKASLYAARNLAMIDERGNLLSELQNIFRIVDHLDASETFNIYNLF